MNKKRLDLKNIWLLHHDNTKLHTISIVRDFLEEGKIEFLAYTTYRPNLVPFDFWVFKSLKWELSNRHFESDVELVIAVNHLFQDLPHSARHISRGTVDTPL